MNKKTKELVIQIAATVVAAGLNVFIWLVGKKTGDQLYWITFFLIWFDLVLAWLTIKQQKPIAYIFFATSIIIEILLIVNIYWISSRVL